MYELIALFGYNAWANARVFDLALSVDPELLQVDAPGTRDTASGTLRHLARVEYAYLAMLKREPHESLESREAYALRELASFPEHLRWLATSYERLLHALSPEDLEGPLHIPWFDFPITVRDGLLQVLSHSSQHRSQVLSWLAARGIATPDLDYVVMLGERARA